MDASRTRDGQIRSYISQTLNRSKRNSEVQKKVFILIRKRKILYTVFKVANNFQRENRNRNHLGEKYPQQKNEIIIFKFVVGPYQRLILIIMAGFIFVCTVIATLCEYYFKDRKIKKQQGFI